MISSKNQRKLSTLIPALTIATGMLSFSSCSTFSRHDDTAENAASEATDPIAQKNARIQELEGTVSTLHSKVERLETQLRASQSKPEFRQSFDRPIRPSVGNSVQASIAGSDPEIGYANHSIVQAYRQGKILFDSEKYPEAILAFSALLERESKHVLAGSAQFYLAESYYLQGEYAVAEQEYTRVISSFERSPQVTKAYARLADCYAKQGKTAEAERMKLQIRALFPSSPAEALASQISSTQVAPTMTAQPTLEEPMTAPIPQHNLSIDKPIAPNLPVNPSALDEPPTDLGGSG